MATSVNKTVRAANFAKSIGVNVHMEYTDGAYASESNVAKDLAYLGISNIRDEIPTHVTSMPIREEATELHQLAARGVKLDLVVSNTDVAAQIAALNAFEMTSPGAIRAVEGANEINNWPVSYDGLKGERAALAFQAALYTAVKSDPALHGASVVDFTGGTVPMKVPFGTLTETASGSYVLTKGITGWLTELPTGVTKVTITYTGTAPVAGLFNTPGGGQQSKLTLGSKDTLIFTYNNTKSSPLQTYISVSDWTSSTTITSVAAISGDSGNLVAFHPDTSLARLADAANGHPYPPHGAQPGAYIASTVKGAYSNPLVITEDGYNTDPNDPNGVSQLAQAQGDLKILLDAYKDGSSQTYLYELLNEKPDLSNSSAQFHFGLFNYNNTAKPAAVAVHDLTAILNDPGATASSFTPRTLNWSDTGLPATGKALLLAKSDGAFDLALWNEPAAGSTTAHTVDLALGATYRTVEVFDPIKGSEPVSTHTDVSKLTLSLGADPLIVEIEPATAVDAAALKPDAVAARSDAQSAGKLSAHEIGAMSAKQIHALTPAQLAAFSPSQLSALSEAAVAGLTSHDIAALKAADIAALKPSEISALGPTQLASFTDADIKALSAKQMAALSTKALAGLKPSEMVAIKPADLEDIAPMRFLAIPDADVSALTTTQMKSLTPKQIAEFSLHQIASISPADIAVLTAAQAPALSPAQIHALTATQVKKLSATTLGHFTHKEAEALTASQLAAMSLAQHHALY